MHTGANKCYRCKAFSDETLAHCDKVVKGSGITGIPMAVGYSAQAVSQRRLLLRARNEHTNKKD